MTRDEQIDAIRQKCIDANPEIVEEHSIDCDMDQSHGYVCHHQKCDTREIRLADVLFMLGPTHLVDGEGNIFHEGEFGSTEMAKWNLLADDLKKQSDETVAFIHSLLCV